MPRTSPASRSMISAEAHRDAAAEPEELSTSLSVVARRAKTDAGQPSHPLLQIGRQRARPDALIVMRHITAVGPHQIDHARMVHAVAAAGERLLCVEHAILFRGHGNL